MNIDHIHFEKIKQNASEQGKQKGNHRISEHVSPGLFWQFAKRHKAFDLTF